VPAPLLAALRGEQDLHAHGIGDNEPYDGGLAGDTIDAVATARGLANALIEVRQDLIAEDAAVAAWAERFARLLRPILADRNARAPKDFGSRARTANGRGGTARDEASAKR
jgi:predicted N-formylglutamate amidohydrolase